jgi:hypothetical protein
LKILVLLFQPAYFGLLVLDFVKQHGVQNPILHRLNLAIGGTSDEVGVNFGDIFGDETVLDRFGAIPEGLLIAES